MLGSISPVGESARGQRWWLTVTAYVVASLAGGAALGLVLGAAGAGVALLLPLGVGWRLALLAAVAALGAAVDAGALRRPLPSWHRQVDERWLTEYRGWVYGAGFGFQLGAAVATIVPAAVTYVALAAALLTFSWQGGLLVGAAFGLVRSLPVVAAGRWRTAERLYRATARLESAERLTRPAVVAGQIAIAGVAAALAAAL